MRGGEMSPGIIFSWERPPAAISFLKSGETGRDCKSLPPAALVLVGAIFNRDLHEWRQETSRGRRPLPQCGFQS